MHTPILVTPSFMNTHGPPHTPSHLDKVQHLTSDVSAGHTSVAKGSLEDFYLPLSEGIHDNTGTALLCKKRFRLPFSFSTGVLTQVRPQLANLLIWIISAVVAKEKPQVL